MVRQCQVCGKLGSSYPELSFHRFPVDPERRNIWLSLTGIANHRLPKHPEICSDHFESSDLIMKANGLRYVKRGANPLPFDFSEGSMSDSSDSNYGSPPRTSNISLTEFVPSPTNSCENGVIKEEQDICEVEDVKIFDTELISFLDSSSVKEEKQDIYPVEDMKVFDTASIGITGLSRVKKEEEGEEDICQVEGTMVYDTESVSIVCVSGVQKQEQDICEVEDVKIFDSELINIAGPSRKRAYVRDLSNGDVSMPKKRRKNLRRAIETVFNQSKPVCFPRMTLRRLRHRITSLECLLKFLKRKSLICESAECAITASLIGPAEDTFNLMLKGPSTQVYDPSLKSFVLTLSFYSTKAYNFVRKIFNRTLPPLGTVSKWYRSLAGNPGFTKEALAALTLKQKESSKPLLCNLVMGEMRITRQTGYLDIGTGIDGDILPEATEALVFMVVCLNGTWKLPIAYFLQDGLSALTKVGLVKKCLKFIHESGVIITSLTFDGAPFDMSMAIELGADFTNPLKLKTSFKHPVTGSKVYIFLDARRMLTFVRNSVEWSSNVRDGNNEKVKWSYVTGLVDNPNVEGLRVPTIEKVPLAAQTISKSISDAISYLRNDIKSPEFKDFEATSKFLLKFNNLFDIFNSKNRFVKYLYKKPFSPETAWHFSEFLNEMKKYILTLTFNGTPIIKSSRKTGFRGFLINITSLQKMYEDVVLEKRLLQHILTYKLSQEHLGLFFGSIRDRACYNNDPTVDQFKAAYKRFVVRSKISAPNAVDITMLPCGFGILTTSEIGDNLEKAEEYLSFINKIKNDFYESYVSSTVWDLIVYVEDVVPYIAELVVKSLKKCVTCRKCLDILESEATGSRPQISGKLINASRPVIKMCRTADKVFRFFHKTNDIFSKDIKNLNVILIHNAVRCMPTSVYDSFCDHLYEEGPLEEHPILLVKLILKNYFKIRIYLETKKYLDFSKKSRLRSFYKSILRIE